MLGVFVFLCLIGVSTFSFSQTESEGLKPNARALALGGSLVVQARDPSAIFWNPALLAGLKDRAILLSINEPFEFNLASFTQFVPLFGTFGVALSRFPDSPDNIDNGSLAWGKNLASKFSLGSSLNFKKLDNDLYATTHLGLFLGNAKIGSIDNDWRQFQQSSFLDKLNLGVTVQNVPLSKKLFEPSAMLGLSYLFPSAGFLLNSGYHINEGKNTSHFGLGFAFSENVTIFSGIEQFDFDKWGVGMSYAHDNFIFNFSYSMELKKLLFTMSARISPHPQVLASPHLKRGVRYFKTGNYKAARHELKKYLAYDLNSAKTDSVQKMVDMLENRMARTQFMADSLIAVANSLLAHRDPQLLRAAVMLTRVLELDPDNIMAQTKLTSLRPVIDEFVKNSLEDGIREFEAGRYEDAQSLFKRVVLFEKDNGTAQYYLAKIEKELNDLADEYFYRGVGYFRQKNYEQAESEFNAALKKNPNLNEATSYLKRTIARKEERKKQIDALIHEGEILESRKNYAEATGKYVEALNLDSDNQTAKTKIANLRPKIEEYVDNRYRAGVRDLQKGQYELAEDAFAEVLAINPEHADAKNGLARARQASKENIAHLLSQADEALKNGNWVQARNKYNEVLKSDQSNGRAQEGKKNVDIQLNIAEQIGRGRKELREQDYVSAIAVYDSVLNEDPNHPIARVERKQAQAKLNEQIEAYFNQGINLYTSDRYEEAIRSWRKVLQLDPNHKGAKEYIKQAHERLEALKKLK